MQSAIEDDCDRLTMQNVELKKENLALHAKLRAMQADGR